MTQILHVLLTGILRYSGKRRASYLQPKVPLKKCLSIPYDEKAEDCEMKEDAKARHLFGLSFVFLLAVRRLLICLHTIPCFERQVGFCFVLLHQFKNAN